MSFYYGVDYYPEHWPESTWMDSAMLMREAGFNVVRLAEFAWALMEPSEGEFDFGWLDRAVATMHSQEISVLLGTPTAAMPAWLKERYPETLSSHDGKHRDAWGSRKNNCFSSEEFIRRSNSITRAMAERYKDNPAVIGWQTDNEIDGPECRCNICVSSFANYLESKYGSLSALNAAWGTNFWGHVYSSWSQIQAPTKITDDNPSLCLDWKRFFTHVQVQFQAEQIKILREVCPRHFITHNYMGFGNHSNCFELARDIDFASFDSYPTFADKSMRTDTHLSSGLGCDETRGLKGKNFWIMETTAGPIGWGQFSRAPKPRELRKTFYHHVAHGADGQLFFRWRTCTSGREQYWHGLLGHDGKAGRRYEESKEIGQEIRRIESHLQDTAPQSDVAVIYDYDSRWAAEIQPSFAGNDYIKQMSYYYDAFRRRGVNVDIVPTDVNFDAYRVVIAPQLYVLPDCVAERLVSFVWNGGILLADLRTGVKDETSLCHQRTLPGLLSGVFGIEIDEYEAVSGEQKIKGISPIEGEYSMQKYADWIRPTTAQPLARYAEWHVSSYCAATKNRYGKGAGYYVGTIVIGEQFYDNLASMLLLDANVQPLLSPPNGVEVTLRTGKDKSLIFVINHTEEAATIHLPRSLHDVLTGEDRVGSLDIPRFGVFVFELPG